MREPKRVSSPSSALSTLRFLGTVVVLVLVFGSCGSLTLGAMDKSQTAGQGSLFNPATLFGYVGHFLQETGGLLTTYVDPNGVPFHAYLLQGAAFTVEFCFISMPLALLVGLLLALMSRSQLRLMRVPARAYVEFFRDTPLLVQLLALNSSLLFLPSWFVNPFTIGVTTLVLNYSAYECENLRAGIGALDRGQGEAAEALGLGYWQTLRLIIIPQTISTVLPPVINDLIYMYKDSSILSLITVTELTYQAKYLSTRYPVRSWQFFVLVGLIYLLLSLPGARLARSVETRLRAVAFAPRRDVTALALQVLAATVAVGWLCGVLVNGISPGSVLSAIGQLFAALGLTVGAVCFALVVLGTLVLVPGSVIGRLRRRSPTARKRGAQPVLATHQPL